MGAGKISTWSNSAICFTLLLFIFFLQLTLLSDVSFWKVKLRRVLSLSQWDIISSSKLITCDRSHDDFDICTVNGRTLFDPAQSTFFTLGPHNWAQPHFPVKIHPYPRKHDKGAMSMIKPVTLISSLPKSPCPVTHRSPALVFSAGGYTGNFFHEFNENFIPLFITVHSLYPDRDVVLVITQGATWWFHKYTELLSSFTRHPIINPNNSTAAATHCFSSATVGLMKHGPITIDPNQLTDPKTLVDFSAWLKNIYIGPGIFHSGESKPSLTLVSRRGNVSRVILNQEEIVRLAEEVGFNVRLLEASRDKSMAEDYKLVHTSHALLGVHGAGLTHLLFLRPGSVVMQVVPIGLEWASRTYYGEKTTRVLGLEYMEYKVEANESSLLEKYGRESLVVKNPEGFHRGDWSKRRIYLREQNVKLNVTRFSKYLTAAYEKARAFMDKYG